MVITAGLVFAVPPAKPVRIFAVCVRAFILNETLLFDTLFDRKL